MTHTRVAVLDDYQGVAQDFGQWQNIDGQITFFTDHLSDQTAVIERLAPFHVVVAMRERTPFPEAVFAGLPNLELLVTTGMRNAAIDLEAASEHRVVVSGTSSPGHATAELASGLILALARGLLEEAESVRSGGWQAGLGRDLHGATLGLVGLGRLGSRVASMGQVFGMNVVAWSQNLGPTRAAEVGVRAVSFDELLASSDFVSIHLRLSDRTTGLFGAAQFSAMRNDAYLVNTSRGPIVDTEALLAAARGGEIAGAAVDVYDVEPLPDTHPLRNEPRIIATPHIGYVTRETYEVFYSEAVENIVAWQHGKPIRTL
jgi:phosphoglycerate dehydrogenase-like enzyme